MSEIDWSKAPEGAAAYAEADPVANRSHKGVGFFAAEIKKAGSGAEWKGVKMDGTKFHVFADYWNIVLRPSQAQWRGPEDGLPPVGAEVEAWIENRKVWAKVTVLAVDVDTVVWRNGTDRRSYIGTHVNDTRPLKSDKDRAVDAAVAATILKDGPRIRAALSDIYDAGLLRLPEEQP